VDKRMSLASRHLLAGSQWDWQAQQRRHHHRLLREALQDLPRVRLLEPAPDSQAVPYVGALLADTAEHGDRIDRHLQAHGVPVMRWLDLAVDPVTGPDPDATDRARRLLQLPCHQSLQDADLHRIARLIRQSAS
jgi:dTDP-4-amino-4,6-dideoxygalactose transaminase